VHPTIPHGKLSQTQAQRQRDYPEAKKDSKASEGDGRPQRIVNMWAMMWGSKRATPGEFHGSTVIVFVASPQIA